VKSLVPNTVAGNIQPVPKELFELMNKPNTTYLGGVTK